MLGQGVAVKRASAPSGSSLNCWPPTTAAGRVPRVGRRSRKRLRARGPELEPRVAGTLDGRRLAGIRMGWAFQATIPREAVASARPLNRGLSELRGRLSISVLRGVNYWRGSALVNGTGTGLVEIALDAPQWVRLGPLPVRMRRLIVSVEDQSALVAALSPSTPRSPGSGDPSL